MCTRATKVRGLRSAARADRLPRKGIATDIDFDTETGRGDSSCYSPVPELFDCDDLGTAAVEVSGEFTDPPQSRIFSWVGIARWGMNHHDCAMPGPPAVTINTLSGEARVTF